MPRTSPTRALALVAACCLAAVAAPSSASARPHVISGTQTVVDEEAGSYKMLGSLRGDWRITSFEELGTEPYYHARGTERFEGCFDRRRDHSCKGDPKGTLSFEFEYWALFGSADPASLVWGACWHPIVSGTGGFAGAQGVVVMADTPTAAGVKTKYTGNLTLQDKGGRAAGARMAAARSSCGSSG
jgi:hypothetical protein